MSYHVPYSSSPPSTPVKPWGLSSNPSTTPAGPPPSSAASFTPRGPPPSTVFGSSRLDNRSTLSYSQSAFGQSVNSEASEDLLNFSTTSSNFPLPRLHSGLSSNRFQNSNTTGLGRPLEPINNTSDQDSDPENEPTGTHSTKYGFLESRYSASTTSQPERLAQKQFIYSNPNNAKRAKLDERWAQQPLPKKAPLPARKKASAFPAIARDLAARVDVAMVGEPNDFILDTEDIVARMYDQVREQESDDDRLFPGLSDITQELCDLWTRQSRNLSSSVNYVGGGVGPDESSPSIVKATFLATLLLPLHHPPLLRTKGDSGRISPTHRSAPHAIVQSNLPVPMAPIPKVLLDWLNQHHATRPGAVDALRKLQPNPTSSSSFWGEIHDLTLRGNFTTVIDLLKAADFNYARSAMEDGYEQPGYRGVQLQNTQQCVNTAINILRSSPGVQYGDWDVKSVNWAMYRHQISSAISDLEDLAEGQNHISEHEDRFQAPNFGILGQRGNFTSFSQSTRMAESKVPWAIYQNIKDMYNIIAGDATTILKHSQDWVEATIGLTVWWDGDDDNDILAEGMNGHRSSMRRSQSQAPRSVDSNPNDAYLHRLDYTFGCVTDSLGGHGFSINSMSPVEVGLASVFEGNLEGVLEMLQTWSLSVTAAVAEVASFGGWLETSAGSRPIPGFDENDLMVLSYGQRDKSLQKDDILINYALGLFDRNRLEGASGSRDGWEASMEVLSRLDDQETMKSRVGELLDGITIDTPEQMDKVVLLCTELGFNEEGRKVSERYGDKVAESTEEYGTALICYARAHCHQKIKNVVDLLTSFCLVRSMAYPATADLDEQLKSLLYDSHTALSAIASVDPEGASMLQFYFCGYASVRGFYDIRDGESRVQKGERPAQRPSARKRAAAETLVAVVRSAADSIYGGLYDHERKTSVQVDGLLVLLGEALAFADEPNRFFTTSEQLTLLAAIEDLQTITSRVYEQCEECLQSTLFQHFHYDDLAGTSFGGATSSPQASFPTSPRNLLKKSVSATTAFSGFSLIGSEIMESQNRLRESNGESHMMDSRHSIGSSGVLVPSPGSKGEKGQADVKRGWDWRAGVHKDIKGGDILRILRFRLAKGLSLGALGSDISRRL